MLSQITPLAERSRGHRYPATVAWYVGGALVGGMALGGLIAALSVVRGAVWSDRQTVTVVTIVVVLLGAAADARALGLKFPDHPRQVDERWLERFRPWAYAGGFGGQVGSGISTYVMTNGTYSLIIASALLLGPVHALVVGLTYGACRGLCVLLAARVTTPERLRTVHARLDASSRASLGACVATQVGVAAICAVTLSGSSRVAVEALVTVVGVACLLGLRGSRTIGLATA